MIGYVNGSFFLHAMTENNVYFKRFLFVGTVIGFGNTMLIMEDLHIYRYSFQIMHRHGTHIDKGTMIHVKR